MSKLIATSQLTLMNLTERAETRRETFYKLTNSADITEVPANAHRNLAQTTSSSWSKPYTSFNGGINRRADLGKVLTDGMQAGDTVKTRIVVKYDNIVPAEGKTAKFWWQGSGNVTSWGSGGFPNTGGEKVLKGSGEIVIEGTDTIIPNHLKNTYWSCNLRFDYVASGSIQWKEEKVEIGKNFTPYTPAPEQLGWSTDTLVPTKTQRYLWKFEYIYYSDGSVEIAGPVNLSIAGQDADATEAINKTKQELLEKLEMVRDDSLAAAEEAKQGLTNVNTKVDSAKAELTQAKQELTTVSDDLSKAKTDLQNAVSAVDTKATNLKNDLTQAKQDLASQAQQLREQAGAQSELTKRVSTVEETANGTKTTVNELSKTVDSNTKNITSVTARTKVVEDDLTSTKTTLSQVKTTADSTSQKTATLESGLNGLSARFNSLSVGNKNYLPASRVVNRGCSNFSYSNTTKSWTMTAPASSSTFGNGITFNTKGLNILLNGGETLFFGLMIKANKACSFNYDVNNALSGTTSNDNDDTSKRTHSPSNKSIPANVWTKVWFSYTAKANVAITENNSKFGIVNNTEPVTIEIKEVVVAKSNVPVDYQTPDADVEQKIAEYKQNADQNYASLQTTVQNLDGTVQHNKTVADQTAQGFTTRIESLETYKDGESTRANQYFESARTETAKQLTAERTAIANNYVAKSTYTSDVTGIRNELSATTSTANATKTNLANYQASNDKMVASLKSSLLTTDGNVSNLQTKVEAVPGQITSAVSAVEGKIPTSVGARNYIRNYGLTATGWTSHKSGWKFEIISDSTAKSGQYLKATCTTASTSSVSGFYKNLFDFSDGRFFGKQMTWSMDIKTSKNTKLNIGCEWGNAQSNVNVTENWQRFSKTFKVATSSNQKAWIFYSSNWNVGDIVYIRDVQLEDGSIATSPVPAIEDTESDISALSSEIKQTADGITLLATKTELNNAKTELQSGINTATNKANNNAQTISTHTTQISALNTGLQAKVSQTDFNTLSGRVTTAENNITAKANELSSKITSVEGKIPTNVSTRNLILKSNDFAKPHKQGGANTEVTSTNDYFVVKSTGYTANAYGGMSWNMSISEVKAGEEFSILMPVYIDSSINLDGAFNFELKQHNPSTTAYAYNIPTNKKDQWFNISITFKAVKDVVFGTYPFYVYLVKNGLVRIKPPMLVRGNLIPSDYQPAFEDTESDITKLSSELTQTKDGITLLATKTELNTAKNELQSGINTATNKANNNAQTISAHTTQISALNTGLQAKVSQTEFNTLSGRVTTAENNIVAKANELSSKITSVEGKIPTSSGGRNLAQGTSKDWSKPFTGFSGIQNTTIDLYRVLTDGLSVGDTIKTRIVLKYTDIRPASGKTAEVKIQGAGNVTVWGSGGFPTSGGGRRSISGSGEIVYELTDKINADHLKNDYWSWGFRTDWVASGSLQWRLAKVERGMFFTDWSPAPEDTANQISSLSSELKQTTDSIKASVSSLDKSTVKSSSLTINSDGIVMKAGKSTTDVANAIGSYFAVNQNAIDLFADKIKVKGSMIVNGTITGDKIKASSVDVSKIVGIDANFIKSKIEHAMIDWLKGKTITAYNDNMTIDLQNGRISFKDGTNAVYRQTPDGIHTGFLHFESGSQGGVYAAFGATSTRQGINSKSSEFAGIRCYRVSKNGDSHDAKIDKIEVIGDTVQFGHGYRSDGTIGGGFIMDTAAYGNETPYSLNRVIKSIESLWRILHDHAKNTGYRFNDSAFINALNNEYNAWHDMHND